MELLITFIFYGILAIIPAYIANSKGYNWKLWFLLAWSLGIPTVVIVTVVVLCLRKRGNN